MRGTYFVTTATYLKAHHFREGNRLDVLPRGILKLCQDFGWQLEAWAVFSNHYHWVARSPAAENDARSLRPWQPPRFRMQRSYCLAGSRVTSMPGTG